MIQYRQRIACEVNEKMQNFTKNAQCPIPFELWTLQSEYCSVIIGIQTNSAHEYHATVKKMSAIKTDSVDEYEIKSFTTLTDYFY